MMRNVLALFVLLVLASFAGAATEVWCPHVTAVAGWKTEIAVYVSGTGPADYQVEKYDASGNVLGILNGMAAGKAWTTVTSAQLAYEGTARVTSSADLLVKAVYQAGDSPSVCEFYLTGAVGTAWVLPNPLRAWLQYAGLALVNPGSAPVTLAFEAWKNGAKAVPDTTLALPAKNKYAMLSNGIWSGVNYADVDTLIVRAAVPIPAPISITGNLAGDRHLFFSAQPEPAPPPTPGDLVETAPIVGNLRYVPAGSFTQGSPPAEPCREPWDIGSETQFTHALTIALAVMETEVTQQMWADLQAVQPTLPVDPTSASQGAGLTNPVQSATWHEAVLFANLLSAQQGLTRCYYTDAGFTTPLTATNYLTNTVYCDWSAAGYRLPTEGEWEHLCRAGTTTAFWVAEPNYTTGNCGASSTAGMYPQLETGTWFGANSTSTTHPVGTKADNPWNLKDVHGNVWEWCWDWYAKAYPSGSATDYRGAASASLRAVRGGSWFNSAQHVRAAVRGKNLPETRSPQVGFRLVRAAR